MHWLKQFMNDWGFETVYQLSKASNVYESTLGKIINKDTAIGNVKAGILWKLGDAVGMDAREFRGRYGGK